MFDGFVPHRGVGAYAFGMTREACIAALGPPDAAREFAGRKAVTWGTIEAWFSADRLVELWCLPGTPLTVAGIDLVGDKAAHEKLLAAHAGATQHGRYVNFPSLGLCLCGFGKSSKVANRMAILYAPVAAKAVSFLGTV